jgi:hypothetical protein
MSGNQPIMRSVIIDVATVISVMALIAAILMISIAGFKAVHNNGFTKDALKEIWHGPQETTKSPQAFNPRVPKTLLKIPSKISS